MPKLLTWYVQLLCSNYEASSDQWCIGTFSRYEMCHCSWSQWGEQFSRTSGWWRQGSGACAQDRWRHGHWGAARCGQHTDLVFSHWTPKAPIYRKKTYYGQTILGETMMNHSLQQCIVPYCPCWDFEMKTPASGLLLSAFVCSCIQTIFENINLDTFQIQWMQLQIVKVSHGISWPQR